ncbi:MAG: M1 family metallopeptidase [Algicola sp.]|nr:M1 family metallopeptidase [Algicola sp.]
MFCFLSQSVAANEFQLSDEIRPTHQFIKLTLDPSAETFTGSTRLLLDISKQTNTIKLHIKDLSIQSITLKGTDRSYRLSLAGINSYDIASLTAKQTINVGKYLLSIDFEGKYTDTGLGLFKVVEDKQHYLFTQFQPMLARTVFPAFDQPDFKIPFQFEITVPTGYQVLGNTISTKTSKPQWDTFSFVDTKPLYTDVLALGVGKFDSVDIPDMPVPAKLYVAKGKLPQSRFILKHSAKLFAQVASFFNIKYPYDKLDFVIVPHYAGAAMENAGLMFFKEDFMLFSQPPSVAEQRFTLTLIAHEIAHMWFGNLVTMKWWNDLWLNESFAQWLANKIVVTQMPKLSAELNLPQLDSLSDDNVETQSPIRGAVKSRAEVDASGQMVYSKGNAILNMVEAYVGAETFRSAIIKYVGANQNGNATFADFIHAIEKASGKPLQSIFSSFLDQPGFPLLNLKISEGKLLLSQQPFGASSKEKQQQVWQVPLKLKVFSDKGVSTHSVLLKNQQMTVSLPAGAKAVFPDAGAFGYYRYDVAPKEAAIINQQIHLLADNEKLAWLENNQHLTKINKRVYADVLSLKLAMLADLSLHHKIANDIVRDLAFAFTDFIPADLAKDYGRYLGGKLANRLESISWDVEDKSTAFSQPLQANLLILVGAKLGDIKAINFAKSQYRDVLAGSSMLAPTMKAAVLEVVATHGATNEFTEYEKAYLGSNNANLKSDIVTKIGYFTQPSLVTRYYEFLLSGAVPSGGIAYRFQYPSFNPQLRSHVLDYIENNKAKILAKISQQQWFPYTFYTTCEADIGARVKAIFAKWTDAVPGLQEKLNAIDGMIQQCILTRAANLPQLKALLDGGGAN